MSATEIQNIEEEIELANNEVAKVCAQENKQIIDEHVQQTGVKIAFCM